MRPRLFIILIIALATSGAGTSFGLQIGPETSSQAFSAITEGIHSDAGPTDPVQAIDNNDDRQVQSDQWLEASDNDFERATYHQTSQGASLAVAAKHGPPTSLVIGESVEISDIATRFHPLRTSRRSPPVATGSLWLPLIVSCSIRAQFNFPV